MFSSALIETTEKILRASFPNGCKTTARSRDLTVVREQLRKALRGEIPSSNEEIARLVRASGTLVDGLVYPFRNVEGKDANALKTSLIPISQIDRNTVKAIAATFNAHFLDGFDAASSNDWQRFRDETPPLREKSDAETLSLIESVGTLVDGRVYVVFKRGRDRLVEMVESLFEEGVGIVFYETFFEFYREELREARFVSLALLKEKLKAYFKEVAFHDDYFERAATPGMLRTKIKREIDRVWGANASLQLQTLVDRLWIPTEKIVDVLGRYPDEYRACGSRYARFAPASNGRASVRPSVPKVAPSPKSAFAGSGANVRRDGAETSARPRLFPESEPRSTSRRLLEKIKNAGIQGVKITTKAEQDALNGCVWAVAAPDDVYVHRASFVELDEAAEKFYEILENLFAKFGGCVDAETFFNAVKIELSMFLNDNDLHDAKQVFCLARHLFEVERFRRTGCAFWYNKLIYREAPNDERGGYCGLLVARIKELGGRASREECVEFLTNLKASNPSNVNGLLKITENADVFLDKPEGAEEVEYVLAETLELTDVWLGKIDEALALVLNEQSPFVVLRDLNEKWFARLPELPFGFEWNQLLLQEIIAKKMPAYRFISAFKNQRLDALKPGLTFAESPIQTFPDLVHAFLTLKESDVFGRRIKEDQLRETLLGAGMLASNELASAGSLAGALNDRRFAWTKNVVVIRP